jgi:hypothetical protein
LNLQKENQHQIPADWRMIFELKQPVSESRGYCIDHGKPPNSKPKLMTTIIETQEARAQHMG